MSEDGSDTKEPSSSEASPNHRCALLPNWHGHDGTSPIQERQQVHFGCDVATTKPKWPEAIALKSVDSETVARALVEILFDRIEIPKEGLTNLGSNFLSKLMTEFYRLTGVTPFKTSVYHPQIDGMVECFNATYIKEDA